MLKFQIIMITILIGCVAFTACERMQTDLNMVMPDSDPDDHTEWDNVVLPAPEMTVEEAAAAMNPSGTGQAHGTGIRTVYFNDMAAMANVEGTAYPAGSVIRKETMNDDNTAVVQIVTMMKTDDPMYADHGGWIYGTPDALPMADAQGCDDCHAKAPTGNRVFVSLTPSE